MGVAEAAPLDLLLAGLVAKTWYDVIRAAGVSEKDAEAIRAAYVYEGFSY